MHSKDQVQLTGMQIAQRRTVLSTKWCGEHATPPEIIAQLTECVLSLDASLYCQYMYHKMYVMKDQCMISVVAMKLGYRLKIKLTWLKEGAKHLMMLAEVPVVLY